MKCHLIKRDKDQYEYSKALLRDVRTRLLDTVGREVSEIKKGLNELYKERKDNDHTAGKGEQSQSQS